MTNFNFYCSLRFIGHQQPRQLGEFWWLRQTFQSYCDGHLYPPWSVTPSPFSSVGLTLATLIHLLHSVATNFMPLPVQDYISENVMFVKRSYTIDFLMVYPIHLWSVNLEMVYSSLPWPQYMSVCLDIPSVGDYSKHRMNFHIFHVPSTSSTQLGWCKAGHGWLMVWTCTVRPSSIQDVYPRSYDSWSQPAHPSIVALHSNWIH